MALKIIIDPHTIKRAEERGASKGEIIDVLTTGFQIDAKYGRFAKGKIYDYNQKRNERYYAQKRIEVFYTMERECIITITAYVFYGKWEIEI